ncbi:MAG: hypothetical protein MET45_29995 [Nostoc sp. LLA-1]|nr:hypothetical protein [Cyanocohniella sp. LLY]
MKSVLSTRNWVYPLSHADRLRMGSGSDYRLNTDDVAFVRKVLKYRQRQREERERKRQKEQERNAVYAARMQTMYGINPPSTPPINEDGNNKRGGCGHR